VPLILRTAKLLSERMREGTPEAVTSMTFVHAATLNYLAENSNITASALSRHLNITKQATSEVVVGLESAGVIRRRAHSTDGRAQILLLTKEGKALLAQGHQRWQQIQDEWVALVGLQPVEMVQEVLRTVLAAVGYPVAGDAAEASALRRAARHT
jgi:DNA-binding MarR family transcriptional regulator